ncbi:hypothetical protein D3C80_1683560 [compost metagenome]
MAFAVAPSFIFTKNGFVSVLVTRHTDVSAADAMPAKETPSARAPIKAETVVFI